MEHCSAVLAETDSCVASVEDMFTHLLTAGVHAEFRGLRQRDLERRHLRRGRLLGLALVLGRRRLGVRHILLIRHDLNDLALFFYS